MTPYYASIPWKTTDWHNGAHTLTVKVEYTTFTFGPMGPQYTTSQITQQITVDLQNLVISDTGPDNPLPILWDPDTMQNVPLDVTAHSAYRANQPVTLWIYDTEQSLVKTLQQTTVVGNGSTTIGFLWDGTGDTMNPETGTFAWPQGIYLFQFQVGDPYGPTLDYDRDKSALLVVAGVAVDVLDYEESTDLNTFSTQYALVDSGNPREDAAEANVRVWDPDLALSAGPVAGGVITNPPGASPMGWNEALFQMAINKPGTYTHVASAKDKHAAQHKGHQQRWALQKGKKVLSPLADNYACIIEQRTDKSAQYWQKRLWDAGANYRGAYAARANGNATAGFIMGALPKDRLMHFWGHGNGTGGSVSTSTTAIRAKRAQPGDAGNYLEDLNLSYLRLAIWQTCCSGMTDTGWGNVMEQTVIQGATCAVGFTDLISINLARQWATAFWQALCQGANADAQSTGVPMTVLDGLQHALAQVKILNDQQTGNYDKFDTKGNDQIKVVPAQ